MKLFPNYLLLLLIGLFALACTSESSKQSNLNIVCTTGMIADGIQNIVGDKATVSALMRAGVDPHLYKATQGDIQKLSNADIIIYNGLHLEGKMAEVLHKLAKKKTVIAVADGLSEMELRKLNATIFDPHIWFSVLHWQKAMAFAAKQIALKDSSNAAFYTLNANKYSDTLLALHRRVQQEIARIPENQKMMITAHDAFGYFGDAYHIKVRGLQGISTITEFGLKDITDLVNFIVEHRVKAVFVESSVPTRAIDAVVEGCAAKGHQLVIGGTLYSDAMGPEGSSEGTYVGMVKSNVTKIVNGLK